MKTAVEHSRIKSDSSAVQVITSLRCYKALLGASRALSLQLHSQIYEVCTLVIIFNLRKLKVIFNLFLTEEKVGYKEVG